MSHVDSLDEETKRILAEVDKTDDSKESDKSKKIIKEKEGYDEYYDDTRDHLPEGEEPEW